MSSHSNILILQGHPDNGEVHLCHALASHYRLGAESAGHEVRELDIADLSFPLLRSPQEWEHGALPESLGEAQAAIAWAQHIVLVFPLWLGDMPALLKGFLEQVARPGFAFVRDEKNPFGRKGLTGRSARVVVTMGMPATIYRYFYRAHSLKSLERNILGFVGIAPIRETLVGMTGKLDEAGAQRWFRKLEKLGQRAQ